MSILAKTRPRPRLKNRNYQKSVDYQQQQRLITSDIIPFRRYEHDPIGLFTQEFGLFLTDDQKKIMLSVVENETTNVQSCHGVGKTYTAALLVIWCVFAWGGLAVTTAPTKRQVEELLWGEIRKFYDSRQDKLGGARLITKLRLSEDARAYGFTARQNDSNGFQGIHKPRMLLIEDEACGISSDIDEAAESCLTGDENKMLRIGNPIAPGTPFQSACRKSHIRVAAWSHPNVVWAYQLEDDGIHRLKPELKPHILDKEGKVRKQSEWGQLATEEMRSHLERCSAVEIKGAISVSWIERHRDREGTAFWESRVEGRFPLDNAFSVIPRRYFLMARAKYEKEADRIEKIIDSKSHKPRYGLDVGDGGDPHALSIWDRHVLLSVKNQVTFGDELDSGRAAGMVMYEINTRGKGAVAVDNIGVGAGALYVLKAQKISARGINWGKSPADTERFANLKAEQFWLLREAMERGEVAIAPMDEETETELQDDWAETYYELLPTGKIKIEAKEKTKAKLGRSPNLGDAAIYGYFAQSTTADLYRGLS